VAKPKVPPPSPAPPLALNLESEFKRDLKRLKKRHKDMDKLRAVIERLQHHRPLERKHRDHVLTGPWKGWRDCHIEDNWLLIYKTEADELRLARTGSHSDIFGR